MENKSVDNKGLKIIKYSYIAAVVFGLVAFILLFLDLNSLSNNNYNAFIMSFDEKLGGLRYLYLIATFFTAILFLWSIYSFVKIMLTKDIKSGVKVNYKKKIDKSPLYAKIYLVFQLSLALFSFVVFIIADGVISELLNYKIKIPVAVSIGIFSLLSISAAGIGDYFYDMEEYKIALELIAEKEKEESKEVKEESKEENKKESDSKRLDLNEKEEKKEEVKEEKKEDDKKEEKVEENNDVKKEESEEENKVEEKVKKEETDENKTPSKSTNHKNENNKSSSSQKSSSSTKKTTSSAKKTTSSNSKSSTKSNSKKK